MTRMSQNSSKTEMSRAEVSSWRRFNLEMADFEGDTSSETMKSVREFCDLTLHEAASRFDVSAGRLLDWEDGTIRPMWSTVFRFSEALGYIDPKPSRPIEQ